MMTTEFLALCKRLSQGDIGPGYDFDRVGNGARVGLYELTQYVPALEAAYRRKCRDNQILRARIRTLEARAAREADDAGA